MNTYQEIADQYVTEKIGDAFQVVPQSVVETEDFYCFTYQHKDYLRTGNDGLMAVGQGPTFIHKADLRIFEYGSAFSSEKALQQLRKQIQLERSVRVQFSDFDFSNRYNLIFTRVLKLPLLVDTLLQLGMEYIIPEVVGENIFRIPQPYKKPQLLERLQELPSTFHHKTGEWINAFYQENATDGLCEMQLTPYVKQEQTRYVNRATEADFKPIW